MALERFKQTNNNLKLKNMTKIQINTKEYTKLLQISHACEFYLSEGLPSTKKRLKGYINELKEINNI